MSACCCRHCRKELPTQAGLLAHVGRMHGIAGASRQVTLRRQAGPRLSCPWCPRDFAKEHGLAIHLEHAHGITGSSRTTRYRRGERLIKPEREPLPHLTDGSPVALLEAVIRLARYDARTDDDAAAWLRDVQQRDSGA